jgi:type IV pilus assembly protein PilC
MSVFVYSAFDKDGARVCGSVKAASRDAVFEDLKRGGLTDVNAYESGTTFGRLAPYKDLSLFCRQMSVVFISEITIIDGLSFIMGQTENRNVKAALEEIRGRIASHFTFAESLSMYPHVFDSYLINMAAVGEKSGSLDNVFADLADYYDKERKSRKKIRAAATYPAVLTALMTAIVIFLVLKILPMFQETLYGMGGSIPAVTQAILSVGKALNAAAPYVGSAAGIVVIICAVWSRTKSGSAFFDRLKLSLPISRRMVCASLTARFARALSIMLKSGIHTLNAVESAAPVIGNAHARRLLEDSVKSVKGGADVADSLEKAGLFPGLFIKMVAVGEATGRLDEMLARSAGIFDEETSDALERFAQWIEPALIIILSVVVGIILISVMLPIISIMNNIG